MHSKLKRGIAIASIVVTALSITMSAYTRINPATSTETTKSYVLSVYEDRVTLEPVVTVTIDRAQIRPIEIIGMTPGVIMAFIRMWRAMTRKRGRDDNG